LTEEERFTVASGGRESASKEWRSLATFRRIAGYDGQRIFDTKELAGSKKWLGLRGEALSRGYHGRVDCTKPARRQSF
jgi:hypothetical protein